VYQMTFNDGMWRMWCDALGRLAALLGKAERRQLDRRQSGEVEDGSTWEHDLELIYTRTA
jgi:hypothetical protein